MKTTSRITAALAALMMTSSFQAHAYDVKPMVVQLAPSGPQSTTTMVITNTHDVPIAIELHAFRRVQNPDGSDKLTKDEADLIMTPPQMVIAPKSSQSVRVRWIGSPEIKQEMAYRIITDQLPIDFKKEKRADFTADLKVKYRYEVALYVEPKTPKPLAKLESARIVKSPKGDNLLEVAISSQGNVRAILDKPRIDISGPSGKVSLDNESLAKFIGLNILPGNTRIVQIPAPKGLAQGNLTGNLTTEYLTVR
jgi:fimbrial chaperone protein